MAVLLAFHLNYVPVHLATETHVGQFVASLTHLVFHEHHHADREQPDHHHRPHPASDHALELAVRNQSPTSDLPTFHLPADLTGPLQECAPPPPLPKLERIKLPGESPPDPLQPRGPPVA